MLASARRTWQRHDMRSLRFCLTFAACAAIAACGGERTPEIADQGGEPIDCALDGTRNLEHICMLEIVEGTDRFILLRPDGGFRRLEGNPERGWHLADGAEDLTVSIEFDVGRIEFIVGGDRFAMPVSLLPKNSNG